MKINKKRTFVWIIYFVLCILLFFFVNTWLELIVGMLVLLIPAIIMHKRFKSRTKDVIQKEKAPVNLQKKSLLQKILFFGKHDSKEIIIALVLAFVAAIVIEVFNNSVSSNLLNSDKKAVATVIAFDKNSKPIGSGSGFFISSDGVLITNYHVIKGADLENTQAKLANGAIYLYKTAQVLDPKDDVAILQFEANDVPTVSLGDSSLIQSADEVYAIGSSLGVFENSVSQGVISYPKRDLGGHDFIQFSAPISSGNSGGVLLSKPGFLGLDGGKVIGMTSQTVSIPPDLQKEVSSQNINFAIPSNEITQIMKTRQSVIPENSADYYTAQGDLADSNKNYDLAILDYQKAISVDDTDSYAFMGLGGEYYNKGNYALEALNYKKAVDLDPINAENTWLLGTAYEDLGQYDQAIAYDEKAIQLDSTNKDSMYSLGILYSITGQKDKLVNLIPMLSKLDSGLGGELRLLLQNLK